MRQSRRHPKATGDVRGRTFETRWLGWCSPPPAIVHRLCTVGTVTTQQPGSDGSSGDGDPDHTPSVPDDVWQQFLKDSEHATRKSAPREPSARERIALAGRQSRRPGAAGQRAGLNRRSAGQSEQGGLEAVGELWQPEEPRTGPAWHELDGRAKCRRVARVLGVVTVAALILVAVRPGDTGGRQGDAGTTVQQSEEAPGVLPSATSTPAASSPGDGSAQVLPTG